MTCARTDKLRYPRRKAAAHFAAAARARTAEPISPYHCRQCHCWHIGHKPGWNAMTALRTVSIACPSCTAEIALPITLERGESTDDAVTIVLVPDMGPARDHHCEPQPA